MSTQCQRPECEGSYEDVGGGELYCDTCGLAPVVSSVGSPPFERGRELGDGLVSSPPTGIAGGGGASSRGTRGSAGSRGSSSSSRASSRASSRSSSRSSTSRRSVSGRLSRSLSGGATSRSVSVRSSGSSTGGSGRGRLGAGLVQVPDVPRPDPRSAVMANPEVPERKRFCSRSDCGAPVGRARGERAGRTEGFCTKCGHPYSFVPKLGEGDIVHGQYEVAGCLAHGGLGWVYLAVDRAVSDRWVVLKGLLDTGDQDAMAAAISERRFLAEIEHSNIVRIYNFVEHLDQRTGSLDGYIVMEYVGGKALKEIANERRTPAGKRDPLPVEQACAYGIEALEALGHLHSRNLLYCDFKVDNAIQTEDQLKLIDMGAVRRMDDDESAIYGTVGYQAPEVAETGPSVASDLYTVARTLAVLTFDFQGYTNVFVDSLPDPDNIEVFRTYESFYRLLVRATDPDPARRFASAAEMAEQLTGVLREVVSLQTGRPRPALSTLFGTEVRVTDTQLFAELMDDVSRLGARAAASAPSGRSGRRRTGARAAAMGSAPVLPAVPPAGPGPGALPAGAPAAAGYAAPGAGPLTAPPTHVRAGGATGPGGAAFRGGALQSGAAFSYAQTQAAIPGPRLPVGDPGAPSVPYAAEGPRPAGLDVPSTSLALPVPRVDASDPNAGFLAGLMTTAPAELISALQAAPAPSLETRLRELRARLEMRELGAAGQALTELEITYPDDWRVVWYRGVTSLVTGDNENAALSFDAVYDAFPGEPAPKLALGICAEVLGQLDNAAEYYRLVWTTDPSFVSAAFGLARVRIAAGDRAGAVRALESVPEASIHYTAARVAAVRARLRERAPDEPLIADLMAASAQVSGLVGFGLDAVRREQLSTEVLGTALDWVLSGSPTASSSLPQAHASAGADRPKTLLGSELDERGLRFGLERSYRMLARLAEPGDERIELVERANRFRPRTWV
ncbi:serine/threonine-protein kinase PknG [Streptomyces sp. NBC_01242]|uniref:serine/threonine-protein kinase n=1 Tax=unclassified Streptomyces TaxID=2593676 RepID=UPI00224F848C|nr:MULTISPECIES: serine/threonine-protein kinase [unclassified Streptomyces]MCX4797463.1 serine/threonine-protein kinase PknG [Streptomyces sp. NBC_01242]WSP65066.1 serine/threonine-protein kinase PknG [Streptomyces sp. NBC_01240]WSU24172.1 serine/threonine-protein kinase PknG [Streptomyces sp. NBC_01108]